MMFTEHVLPTPDLYVHQIFLYMTFLILKDLKIAPFAFVLKLRRFCRTEQISCFPKTHISVSANQPSVKSHGVALGRVCYQRGYTVYLNFNKNLDKFIFVLNLSPKYFSPNSFQEHLAMRKVLLVVFVGAVKTAKYMKKKERKKKHFFIFKYPVGRT